MAIALDATSVGNADGTGTTLTFAHTCTGTDLVLVVNVWVASGSAPTVTYAAVSMTLRSSNTTNNRVYQFVLADPTTGANNIVVTVDNEIRRAATGISFKGAQNYSDVSNATNAGSTSASVVVQTNEQTGFVVGFISANAATLTYTGGGTEFGAQEVIATPIRMSTAYQSFTGSADIDTTYTLGASNSWGMSGVEIYQVPSASGFFFAVDR